MEIEIINTSANHLPKYANPGDAGCDVCADFSNLEDIKIYGVGKLPVFKNDSLILYPGSRVLIPTGIYLSIPEGYEIQVRSRSGLALKHGIQVINSPGTLDHGWKGNTGVILINHGKDNFEIKHGDRIAQFVLNKIETIDWQEVIEFTNKYDRNGGFGSTGK